MTTFIHSTQTIDSWSFPVLLLVLTLVGCGVDSQSQPLMSVGGQDAGLDMGEDPRAQDAASVEDSAPSDMTGPDAVIGLDGGSVIDAQRDGAPPSDGALDGVVDRGPLPIDMAPPPVDVALPVVDMDAPEPDVEVDMSVRPVDVGPPVMDMEPVPVDIGQPVVDMVAPLPDLAVDAAPPPDLAVDATPPPDLAVDAAPPPDPFPDLSIGPYDSALTILIDSALSLARNLDVGVQYTDVASQGYLLQTIGELLWAARGYELDARDQLVQAALDEVAELRAAADRVVDGGPAYGLPDAWDAFGDGSVNPAFTAYTWQSGSVAFGVAKLARYLVETGHPQAAEVRDFGVRLVQYWLPFYTANADGGWYWYSDRRSDAIAVHNTSALVAMAGQLLTESGGPAEVGARSRACVDLLWARMRGNPDIGYQWNYADDGYPVGSRRPEDVSHALITLQLMRFAADRGWWRPNQMRGVAHTLTQTIWRGDPTRLAGRVDGSDAGDRARTWTRAAVVGYAAHGDAVGGDPAVFDYARSILFSSYMTRYERRLQGATVSSVQALALAMLLARRPAPFATDSRWVQVAGPGDDALPDAPGGVRFFTVEWDPPAALEVGGIRLSARQATTATANILIDLPADYAGRVVVALTYQAAAAGVVQEWDGARYHDLAPLPSSIDDTGTPRWIRTTFQLNPAIRFDYQRPIPGANVLLQLTNLGAIHRIEATPLD